ncbi:MAG: CCA tRNA nucleotidyltransferase [Endomicrobium sp.]|jgi:putative nucleotidyltransferase with HDIG domain|nr:CCA tRNA nucleotidyltransferase [Endomicrobium sp.]
MKNIAIPKNHESIIYKISTTAKENNFEAYIVGGFVRDLLLDREPKDLDVMVCAKKDTLYEHLAGINFSKIVANKYKLLEPVVFEKFGTSKLFIDCQEVEFIMPRKEYYDSNSRNPETQPASLKQDALRRDFTINALFLRLDDMKILDLTSKGLIDLKNKIIRVTDPPNAEIIFRQDPLRILRAIRQSLQLGFSIENETYDAMKISVPRIKIISHERVRDEINKILVEINPSKAFMSMDEIDLLDEILPEITRLKNLEQPSKYHIDDVFAHSLKVLDRTSNDVVLRMAALLHDIGKYSTHEKTAKGISFHKHDTEGAKEAESILKRLKYSREFIKKTVTVIQNHMYPKMYSDNWTDSAVRRFVKKCGNELNLIMQLSKADYGRYSYTHKLTELNRRIEDLKSKNMLSPKSELISGEELMEIFNKPAGKWIQTTKNTIEEMLLENPILTKEEVIEVIKKLKNEKRRYT